MLPERMETVDDETLARTLAFMDRARRQGRPCFVYFNPTSMHVVNHLPEKYRRMRTPENGWGIYEVAMARLDDLVGALLEKVAEDGRAADTLVVFTTDNGAENFTWPDGGQTPFAGGKGTVMEGGFRVPCLARWPGRIPAGRVENGLMSGLDWFPTLVAAAGNPDIVAELKDGKTLGERRYKAHLDGYNKLGLLVGGEPSRRNEVYYFADETLGALRIGDYKYRFIDQAQRWLGAIYKVEWPMLTNIRLDPFERTGLATSWELSCWGRYDHRRFVFVHEEVARFSKSFLEFPPLQPPASLNLEAVRRQVAKALHAQEGAQAP
jgi:arylsulfatase